MQNREIRFRVWDDDKIENKATMDEMIYFDLSNVPEYYIGGNYHIMQYTGLKDKNGKEVYEGDIIVTRYSGGDRKGQIYYGDVIKWGVYNIGCNGYEYPMEVVGPYVKEEYLYGLMIEERSEIIGNIYENPELLDEKVKK